MTQAIQIDRYQPGWPDEFQRLARSIRVIAPAGSSLHHIGSTAVPGLSAKDIIDIQLTVDTLSDIDVESFREIGFEHMPGRRDHCPAGLSLSEEDLAKAFFRSSARPAHLHVRERGRFNQRYALLCRDYLRSHPDAATAYGTIKMRLATLFPYDSGSYYDIKDPVFDILMAAANEWAQHVSWREPPSD